MILACLRLLNGTPPNFKNAATSAARPISRKKTSSPKTSERKIPCTATLYSVEYSKTRASDHTSFSFFFTSPLRRLFFCCFFLLHRALPALYFICFPHPDQPLPLFCFSSYRLKS